MNKHLYILLLLVVTLCGCGDYQKVLKSTDPDFKFEKALEYFNNKQYSKSQTLLDDVSAYYKGTERSEEVLIYLARCYMGMKDYASASEYYQAYTRSYPKGKNIAEARFMLAHSYYMDSPDARLDQDQTHKAIESYTQFVELYPESPYASQAYDEMQEMYDKLAYKDYLSAKLYYNLGSYLGNNYLAAETVAKNTIKKYPGNKHIEELSWIIVQAKYQQALMSVEALREERIQQAEDECYNFVNDFPDSKHVQAATNYQAALKKMKK